MLGTTGDASLRSKQSNGESDRREELPMPTTMPDATTRWRCGGCGNLTRFDVTRQTKSTEFWHFDLAGQSTVETAETLSESVLEVRCRWCGRDDAVQVVARPDGSP